MLDLPEERGQGAQANLLFTFVRPVINLQSTIFIIQKNAKFGIKKLKKKIANNLCTVQLKFREIKKTHVNASLSLARKLKII